jgi:AcrR family transcriptional regulator
MAQSTKPRRRRAPRGQGAALRGAILEAARQLLAETGSEEAVSVRSVAEKVGVTTPSIYRHFKDKDDLMDAVCSDVFGALANALAKAADGAAGPLDRLLAQGRAYIDFALANSEEYRMVFMGGCAPTNTDDVLTNDCFSQVIAAVGACMEAGIFPSSPDGPLPVAMRLFAAVHGLAALLICKPWMPWGDVGSMVEAMLLMCAAGCSLEGSLASLAPAELAGELSVLAGRPARGKLPGRRRA